MVVEKSVAAVVVNQKREYLLLHPSKGKVEWVLPGGHQEKGETDETTLRRELSEECGLDDFEIVDGFSEINSFVNSAWNNRVIVVRLVKVRNPKIVLSHEHSGFEWVGFDDAMKKLNHDKWRAILSKADIWG